MEHPKLKEKVNAIAVALTQIDAGSAWHFHPKSEDSYQMRIANGEHEDIWFSDSQAGRGKLHISVAFPWINDKAPDTRVHLGINVSETKEPGVIAKDILTRLLPDYRTELANVIARAKQHTDFQSARIELAKQISQIWGHEWTPGRNFSMSEGTPEAEIPWADLREHGKGKYAGLVYECKAVVNSAASVKFIVDVLRPEIAEQIAAAIKHVLDRYIGDTPKIIPHDPQDDEPEGDNE